MAFFLSPVINEQQFDANGDPRAGALITTYLAGTLTPVTTYKTSTGTAHSNPIQLDSSGNYPNGTQLWLQGGLIYKFVITDSDGANSRTYDDITGVGDDLSGIDQWVLYGAAPTYISATSFSVVGDQTNTFQARRRLKSTNSGGTTYSTIFTAVFSAGITTVTVINTSGVLDAGLSAVSYGLLSAVNPSIPVMAFAPMQSFTGSTVTFSAIPAGVKRITVQISGMSSSGTNTPGLQIGSSAGLVTSGYLGTSTNQVAGGVSVGVTFGSTFGLSGTSTAAAVVHGTVTLTLMDIATNLWACGISLGRSDTAISITGGGTRALPGTLDRFAITVGGDTFDAGTVSALYEF